MQKRWWMGQFISWNNPNLFTWRCSVWKGHYHLVRHFVFWFDWIVIGHWTCFVRNVVCSPLTLDMYNGNITSQALVEKSQIANDVYREWWHGSRDVYINIKSTPQKKNPTKRWIKLVLSFCRFPHRSQIWVSQFHWRMPRDNCPENCSFGASKYSLVTIKNEPAWWLIPLSE